MNVENDQRWRCESGAHSGEIEIGSVLHLALQQFRSEGGKGPMIIPAISCPFCNPETIPEKKHQRMASAVIEVTEQAGLSR